MPMGFTGTLLGFTVQIIYRLFLFSCVEQNAVRAAHVCTEAWQLCFYTTAFARLRGKQLNALQQSAYMIA